MKIINKALCAKGAFSLLEMLVAIGIFSLVIIASLGMFVSGRRGFELGGVQIEVEQEARRALDYMSKELRQAGRNKIQAPAEGASSSTIIFEIPYNVDNSPDGDVIDASGNIEWSNDAGAKRVGTITYSLVGGQILRNLSFTGEQSVLGNRITGVTFSWPSGTDIIDISLTAEKYALAGFTSPSSPKVTINLNTQVRVRN